MSPTSRIRTSSNAPHPGPGVLAPGHDDPLDAALSFDDITMLGFALVAILGAISLLALGF